MMTNLLHGAHVANKLFSTIARLRLLLVMFIALTASTAWGATAEFAPNNFSGQGTSGTGSAISATVNGVTFACDKGFGTTQFRCYGKSTITISSSNTITAISFTFSGSYTGGLETSYTNLNTNSWEQTLSSQARITQCVVTYEDASTEPCTVKFYKTSTTFESRTEESAGDGVTPPTMEEECGDWTFQGWSESFSVSETSTTKLDLVTLDEGIYYPTEDVNLYPVYTKSEGGGGTAYTKVATISEGVYVMVSEKTSGTYKYMPNTTSSGTNPNLGSGITISTTSGITSLTNEVTDAMLWDFTSTGTANQFYLRPHGSTTIGLGCTTSTGANIRISSTYKDVKWTITTSSSYGWQFKSNASSAMYLAVYSDSNWRNYTSSTTNQNGKFHLFKQTSSSTTYYFSYPQCATEPTLSADPTNLDFGEVTVGQSQQKTFTLTGQNIKNATTLSINGATNGFSVSPFGIDDTGNFEKEITVTYAPTTAGDHSQTIVISSEDADDVTVSLSGTGVAQKANYTVKHYQQNITDDNYTLKETETLSGEVGTDVTPAVKSYEGFTAPTAKSVEITADGNAVVEYRYTRNSYTLTWNVNGGTITTAGTTAGQVKYGAPLKAPTVEKTNFQFKSWTPAVPETMPADAATYTAQWTPIYTITWLANGQEHHVQTDVEGTAIEIPAEPEAATYACEDKVFVGWVGASIDGSTNEEPDFITDFGNVKENKTYYAVFATPSGDGFTLGQSGDFKIYANVEGNNIYAATYNNGKLTSTNEDISAVTFKFTHKENNQYTIYNGSKYVAYGTDGTDLKIQSDEYLWTIAPATNEKGSWRVTSVQYPSRAIIYRTGYDFKAYGTNNITTNGYYDIEIGGATTYTEYVTSCVTCENVLTIIKGNEENGTFILSPSGEIKTCDGDLVVTVSEISPAEHHSVASVTATTPTTGDAPTVTNNGNGNWTVTYKQNSTGESTINVTFEEDAKASITLSELGVENTDNTTYYVGETYILPSTSSQSCDGKQLVGWSTVEVAETNTKPTSNYYELGAEVTLAETQTFYAVFATAGEGGVDNTDYSNVHTSNVTLTDEGGTNATDSKVKIGGIDYTAVKAGTGSAMGAVNITVPSGTTKLSFHMVGWNGEGNKTISLSGATADPSSFKTVADAGVSGNSTTYTLSGTIADYFYSTTLSNINTETTLTFSNGGADQRFVIWGVNASTGGGVSYSAYTTSCVPTYSITYDFAGGTGSHCSNTSVPQGDPYTICDEAPTKEGHTFLGWSDGINTYQPNNSFTPEDDITLTAQWQIKTYTVTWSNNSDTDEVPYNHGDALVVPTAASCDGVKEFVGWTEQSGYYHATTAPDDIFTTKTTPVTADATYYAVFATPPGTGGGGGGSETTTLDFTAQGYSNGGAISNLTVSGVTATFDKGSNSNAPKYYTTGTAIRAYGGNTITLSSTGTITNVTFTFSGGDDGNEITTNNGDGEWNEPTWTGNTTSNIVFTIGGASGHRRIKSIAVTYTSGGGSGSYSDYTTTCQQVESIEVQNPQTEFYLTDNFTIGEGKVMATLSDGITEVDVTSLATFSGYNMEVVGTYTVTVTYMGATATYNINVKPLDNAWVLTWNVSGKTNTGLGPRYVTKNSAIGTLPTPEVPAACAGKTFMGWTTSNVVNSDGSGITYINEGTVPTDNTTYYAVFATVNNFCTQKPIEDIASGSKVVIVAVASLTDDGGAGKAISSRPTDDTYNLQGDSVAIYDQTINTPHSTCIWTITEEDGKYIFTQDEKYLNGAKVDSHYNLKYNNTKDTWSLTSVAGKENTYRMQSTNTAYFAEFYTGKFTLYKEANDQGEFDMQFFVTANANGNADITDYTTGCAEYTITYYGFRGGYSTSCSSDGTIVLPVNSIHTIPNCEGLVINDHTNLNRTFTGVWMTKPHGGHTFKPGDTFILTQDTTLYAQWELNTQNDFTTLPTDVEDLAGTDIYVYGGKTLTLQPGTTTINSLTLKGGLQADGSYKMPTVWVPEGATLVRNSNKINLDLIVNAKTYYPFAVPFATKNDQYIDYLDPVLNAASTYGTHFVIKTYDGELRAKEGEDRDNNWVKVLRHTGGTTSYLEPGVGYIITALTYPDKDTATIRIPMTVPNTWFENGEQAEVGTTVRNTIAVTAHAGAAATEHQRHAGWNFVANPYLSNFTGGGIDATNGLDYIDGELIIQGSYEYSEETVPYVTIPAYNFAYYSQHKLSDVKLSPEWSFFVQVGTGGTMNFTTAGRQQAPAHLAARAAEQPIKMDVDLILSDNHNSDQTGIIISDRYSDAYEIGHDLEKLFGSAYNLSVYTLMADNTPLAFQALAIQNSMQLIPVGYRTPAQGEYTFALNEATSDIELLNEQYEQLILVDYETGALTNMLNNEYTFYSDRTQSNNRFALYAVPRQNTTTDLPNTIGNEEVRKVIYNDHFYILRDGKVFNGAGQIVK